ncbi:E-selectin-like isoform X2 [Stylophora pistillata]|uniref:E-selectin-like isoform X2 n=1 Tax=Stylophora pistillata TaxID=50429 RepID=UPI000C04F7D8|nr:E-selectin-like isoform X2 [Stylophora pistillata]
MEEDGRSFKLLGAICFLSLAFWNKVSTYSVSRRPCNSPLLLVSTYGSVVAVDLDNNSSHKVTSNLSEPLALDFHYNLGYIFWSDRTESNIKRSNMDGTNITVIHNNVQSLGLAVEWNSLQLYWTDYDNRRISLSDLEGNNRTTVLSTIAPGDIVVDPHEGMMFWETDTEIEKSALNGTQRVVMVRKMTNCPRGITLDRQRKLVFWVEDCGNRIDSSDYNGNNRKLLIQIGDASDYFYGVVFTASSLFVGGYRSGTIFKVNTASGAVVNSVQIPFHGIQGVAEYDCTLHPPAITCPGMHSPTNGITFGCSGNATESYDTVCHFGCSNGYIGSGSQSRRCQQNGTWSGREFVCGTITCPGLSSPMNGTRIGCSVNETEYYDTVCQFTCNNGFIGSGSPSRKCQQNGTWSGQQFSCEIINCSSLTIDPGGPLSMSYCGNQHGAKCNFSCPIGYRLNGSSVITCVAPGNQNPGVWNDSVPTCEGILCESLQLPPSMRMNGSCSPLPGNACQFTCKRGFNLIGSAVRWCDKDGSWTGMQPRCEVVACPMLSLPTYGVLLGCNTNTTQMLYGSECRFSCEDGSIATGSTGRRCTENGTWTGTDL